MNTYDRFLSSLLSEFKRKAQPQVRSLWADLMELEEAIDERALSMAREQALRRIHVLGQAADASQAHPVRSLSQTLEHMLGALTQTRAATCPELFTHLHGTIWMLADTLYSMDVEAPASERADQPTEPMLVESCVD
jgi:chemotaxis protein histidine kinase CheA